MRLAGAELDHIGIVVPSIVAALPFYRDTIGLTTGEVHEMPDQAVRVVFLEARPPSSAAASPLPLGAAAARIELLEPLDDASGVARFLAQRGKPTLHHVCFAVDDLAGALRELAAAGHELIDPEPRRGAIGMVAFLHPRAADGVLIELIDRATIGR